ncbi:MAG: hypothetical protein IPP83_07180 [Flavobacteriales bacterium]|nr:hypothetical protein [Flavobacteriales bacterium]
MLVYALPATYAKDHMDDSARLVFASIIGTMVLLVLIGTMGVLLVVNANRRHRHSAQMADLQLQREQEVRRAEREATQHTLKEVARDLHDNVAQILTVAQLGLNHLLVEDGTNARIIDARDSVDRGVEEVRRLGHDLNSDLWQDRTLVEAIRLEMERIERVARVRTRVDSAPGLPELPTDSRTILFRVFQEVVNNALKHSGADSMTITFATTPAYTLSISDNGCGFNCSGANGHGGLVNIHKRCDLIGFSASCVTAPGKGCTWNLQQQPTDHGRA